ncbi:hypothetical protein [Paraclostridium bifermentans]|uniref:hypothetical protein n=1 Tax=Paraclostridium bifermentans TaxID=1490 RepID=UPI00359C5F91
MKNKKILGITTACVLCTSSIVFASDLKLFKKDNVEYVPLKKMIQKAGGKVDESNNFTKISINGNNISIDKDSSFAKIGKEYYPLNEKKINGYNVPVDTKPLYEDKEVYIDKNFLKDNKIVDYKIDGEKIIITTEKSQASSNNDKKGNDKSKENKEKKEQQETNDTNSSSERPEVNRPTKPETSRPTRPSKPSTGDNSNNSSNNSGNNSSSNTGGNSSEDTSTDTSTDSNNKGSTGGDAGNTENTENTGDNNNNGSTDESGGNNTGPANTGGDSLQTPPETTVLQAVKN